jgi:uncharacterized protein (DUF433 family)
MGADRLKRITVEEGKCGGRPCVRGMRIRVSDILDLLSAGTSYDQILADFPSLEREDILAAIEWAKSPDALPRQDGAIDEVFDATEVESGVGEGAMERKNWYR